MQPDAPTTHVPLWPNTTLWRNTDHIRRTQDKLHSTEAYRRSFVHCMNWAHACILSTFMGKQGELLVFNFDELLKIGTFFCGYIYHYLILCVWFIWIISIKSGYIDATRSNFRHLGINQCQEHKKHAIGKTTSSHAVTSQLLVLIRAWGGSGGGQAIPQQYFWMAPLQAIYKPTVCHFAYLEN